MYHLDLFIFIYTYLNVFVQKEVPRYLNYLLLGLLILLLSPNTFLIFYACKTFFSLKI